MATTITVVEENVVIEVASSGPQGPGYTVTVDAGELTNTGTATAAVLGLATTGTAGTYTKVTTDSFGRVSSGTTLAASDIPTLAASKITGTAVTQADNGTITSTMIANNTINNGDINSGAAIDPTKIAGTAVITTDSRLSDARTPTDGSVTNAKITSAGIDMSVINSGAIAAWQPSTSYTKGDLVSYLGVAYRRIATSTSGATFDPANWNQITPTNLGTVQQRAKTYNASTSIDVPARQFIRLATAVASGTLKSYLFTPDENITLTKISHYVTTAAVWGSATTPQSKVAIYSVSGNVYTPIVISSWTATPFTTAGQLYDFTIASTTLTAGTTYAVGLLTTWSGTAPTTIPQLASHDIVAAGFAFLAPSISWQATGQTDITSSAITATTGTGSPFFQRLS